MKKTLVVQSSGYKGDEIPRSYVGIVINHYQGSLSNNQDFMESLFPWLNWLLFSFPNVSPGVTLWVRRENILKKWSDETWPKQTKTKGASLAMKINETGLDGIFSEKWDSACPPGN